MSTTPRTDAEAFTPAGNDKSFVDAAIARQLETELNAVLAANAQMRRAFIKVKTAALDVADFLGKSTCQHMRDAIYEAESVFSTESGKGWISPERFKEEVEKAYKEGWYERDEDSRRWIDSNWNNSLAKRVAEGKKV